MKLTKDDKERILSGLANAFDYDFDCYLGWEDYEPLTEREKEQRQEEKDSLNKYLESCKKLAKIWGYDFLIKRMFRVNSSAGKAHI